MSTCQSSSVPRVKVNILYSIWSLYLLFLFNQVLIFVKINQFWDLFEHKTKIRTYLKKLDENWDQKGILTLIIIVCVYSLVFGIIVKWGLGYTLYSPFTHIHFIHYMSRALYPGLSCLELEGIVQQCHSGCTSQVVIVRTPARVCLLHWYSHFLLFTNCRGKCHEVGHSSSDLDIQVLGNYPCEHIQFPLEL